MPDPDDLYDPPSAPLSGTWTPAWWRRLDKSPLQRALTLAVLEAGVVAGMVVVNEAWIVPLLLKQLDAPASSIGLLTIIPMLVAMVVGPLVAPIINAIGGNKRVALWTCWWQVLCFAGLLLPLHFAGAPWALPVGFALAIGVNAIGAIAGPAWMSWMGDLVPRSVRGRYISNRLRVHHVMRIACAAGFAGIMQTWPAADSKTGLAILLGVAVVSRLASWWLMRQQFEPPPRPRLRGETARVARAEGRGFLDFLRAMPRTPIGRWTLVWAALLFGATIAGPFFQPYMLKDVADGGLGLGDRPYVYTLLIYLSTIVRLLAFPLVGRLVDRFGAAPILRVAVVGITLIPVGWTLTPSIPLLLLTEVVSGVSWCMAECSVGVLLFSCASDPSHRARLIGYHQSVCCAAIVIGGTIGSQLLKYDLLPTFDGSAFRMLFLVSTLARVPAVIMAMRLLPELADREGMAGMWRWIPGLEPTIVLGRELVRSLRRP